MASSHKQFKHLYYSFITRTAILLIFFFYANYGLLNASLFKGSKRILYKSEKNQPQTILFPDFFSENPTNQYNFNIDTTGKDLNLKQFVQIYLNTLKDSVSRSIKAISAQISDKKTNDITYKLGVVNVQLEKELLKNTSQFSEISFSVLKKFNETIIEVNKIITAPKEETLENLHKSFQLLRENILYYLKTLKKYISIYENFIKTSNENYQTLELIPTLSIQYVDLFVHSSKSLMKFIQSFSEAQKGFLLNLQTECENVITTIENMNTTINTTLRFSDHFAFRQYPVINLPASTREKLYNYLNTIKSSFRSINNTLSISDTQTKNHAQQLAQFSDNLWNKVADSLRYNTSLEGSSIQNLPQISTYSHNQVCGLFQRTKEFITLVSNLAKRDINPTNSNNFIGISSPNISIETPDQASMRKAANISDKLPLFLLGDSNQKNNKIDFSIGDNIANNNPSRYSSSNNAHVNFEIDNLQKYKKNTTTDDELITLTYPNSNYYPQKTNNANSLSNNFIKNTSKNIGNISKILYIDNDSSKNLFKKEFLPEELDVINTEFADILLSNTNNTIKNKEKIYNQLKPKVSKPEQKLMKYNYSTEPIEPEESDFFKLDELPPTDSEEMQE